MIESIDTRFTPHELTVNPVALSNIERLREIYGSMSKEESEAWSKAILGNCAAKIVFHPINYPKA